MFPNGRSAAKVWSTAQQLDVKAEQRGTLTLGEFAELRARESSPKESPCDDNDSHATCLITPVNSCDYNNLALNYHCALTCMVVMGILLWSIGPTSDTRDNVCMHRVCCHMHKHGEQLVTNGSCVQ